MTSKTTAADTAHVSGDPVPAPVARGVNRGLRLLFAIAGSAAVGNLCRVEPLPDTIADSPHISPGSATGSRPGPGATTGSISPCSAVTRWGAWVRSPASGVSSCPATVVGPAGRARRPARIALAWLRAHKPWIVPIPEK
ncbi:hypothetical protein OOK36_00350 [Streptomyces sp. NBC_00365]|uniref:hypothetical protein n=1 Tax=Streptomyces sp. NBC_00365 TaxID=2975726 RepID=UPI00224CD4EE|nr:hypothetical protein [Streptomyces sp. NBC_00365]MCX5087421.1 hypothetical protein [Streptomyces sp. NBC_00365]